jgi:hypothetical protein
MWTRVLVFGLRSLVFGVEIKTNATNETEMGVSDPERM